MRTLFLSTPDFGIPSLDVLNEKTELVGVVTQPDRPRGRGQKLKPSPIKKHAQEKGIDVYAWKNIHQQEALETIRSLDLDLVVVTAFGQILKSDLLNMPRLGCWNLHASLLPRWRGASPIQQAILSGDAETGITLMQMNEALDAGDILLQKKVSISDEETAGELHDRLSQLAAQTLNEALDLYHQSALFPRKQDATSATYAPQLTSEIEKLDPMQNKDKLVRKVRALSPMPGAYIEVEDLGRIKLFSVKTAVDEASNDPTGSLFEQKGKLYWKVQNGVIQILSLQPQGKKCVSGESWINQLKGRGQKLPLQVKGSP